MRSSTSLSGAHSSALQSGSSEEALTTETDSFRPADLALRNLPRGLGDANKQPFGDSKTFEVQDMVDQILGFFLSFEERHGQEIKRRR